MQKTNLIKLFTVLLLIFTISVNAQQNLPKKDQVESSHSKKEDVKATIKKYIQYLLKDSHSFTLFAIDEKEHTYVSMPLPVILIDGGLKVFSSSKFNHGYSIAEVDGNYYKIYNGKIYKTNAKGTINYNEANRPTNKNPLDFSITKNVVMIFITGLLMLLLFSSLARSYAKNGGIATGIGRFFEPIILYIRDDIAIPNIGEKHYRKYMGYLLTVFFFIWFLNMFGLTPLKSNVTGNITVTFSLAILTFLITAFTANKDYWKHIFWMPGVPVLMKFILAPIELLGTFIKPFSLMIRLYANIVAGHIVLMGIIGLVFIFKSWIGSPLSLGLAFALMLLKVFVAVLQAYIFTMLTALYFGVAKEEHH